MGTEKQLQKAGQRLRPNSLVLYDTVLVIVVLASTLGYMHVFNSVYIEVHAVDLSILVISYPLLFSLFHLYDKRFPYAGFNLFLCVALVNIVLLTISMIWQRIIGRQVLPGMGMLIAYIVLFVGTSLPRLLLAMRQQRAADDTQLDGSTVSRVSRIVILGYGQSTLQILSSLNRDMQSAYHVVGILDPDPKKRGMLIEGIRVLGEWERIYDLIRLNAIDEIVIASHNDSGELWRDQVLLSCQHRIPVRLFPITIDSYPLRQIGRGPDADSQLGTEIFLQRPLGNYSTGESNRFLYGKRILVSAAGGSLGRELCHQICAQNPAVLILFEQDESTLLQTINALHHAYPDLTTSLVPVIGDARDAIRIHQILNHYHPQVVYHAAGYTTIELMEENAIAAINTDIAGTMNVIKAAQTNGVETAVFFSSSKAVSPTTVVGASSAIREEFIRVEEQQPTRFVLVRLGEIVDSPHGVLTTVCEQLSCGEAIVVPYPEVCRNVMCISEAASLALFAGCHGKSRQLFIPASWQPVSILHLIEDFLYESGIRVGEKTIKYRGLP
ncbi:MAG TPA: polysaccharide biosynthesis protein, partial [Armatimonadota bacterium]|nr:polysaccharide biosynthesis protein [Armatimonadota bacterium]